jgi:hypothetical protein
MLLLGWPLLKIKYMYKCTCDKEFNIETEYVRHLLNDHKIDRSVAIRIIENSIHQTNNDSVNHPSHYTFSKYEVLDVLMEWFPDNPLLWQVNKYIARAKHKGNYIEDLEKARFYLDEAIGLAREKENLQCRIQQK